MKTFVFQILIFSLTLSFTYPIGVIVFGYLPKITHPNLRFHPGSGGYLFTRLNEAKEKSNVDLLIVGSSHAYRGFDTRIFEEAGIETFNLGSSAQTPVQTYYLLNKYLHDLKPKTVIYEVYPETFTFDGIEAEMDIISNDEISFDLIETLLTPFNFKTFNSSLFSKFHDVINTKKKFKEPSEKDNSKYIDGGFVEFPVKKLMADSLPKKKLKLQEYQFNYFDKCLELLSDNQVRVIFVYSPISKPLKNSYINEQEFYRFIEQKEKEFWDFSDHTELCTNDNFFDFDHLNQNGVIKFNKEIIKKIKEHY